MTTNSAGDRWRECHWRSSGRFCCCWCAGIAQAARFDRGRRCRFRRHRDRVQCAVHAVWPASGADLRQQAGACQPAAHGVCRRAATKSRRRQGRVDAATIGQGRRHPARDCCAVASMKGRRTASMAQRPTRQSATSSRRRACGPRLNRMTCCSLRSPARPSRRSRSRSSATIRSRRCSRPAAASSPCSARSPISATAR